MNKNFIFIPDISQKQDDIYNGRIDEMYIQPDGFLPRSGHLMVDDGSTLYLFGGSVGTSAITKYNISLNFFNNNNNNII